MLDLEDRWQAEARRVLTFYLPACRVFVFGSRVRGTAHKFSDLDLAVDAGATVDLHCLQKVRDAFSLSDLPMRVDLIDLHAVDAVFAASIAPQQELFWEKRESAPVDGVCSTSTP